MRYLSKLIRLKISNRKIANILSNIVTDHEKIYGPIFYVASKDHKLFNIMKQLGVGELIRLKDKETGEVKHELIVASQTEGVFDLFKYYEKLFPNLRPQEQAGELERDRRDAYDKALQQLSDPEIEKKINEGNIEIERITLQPEEESTPPSVLQQETTPSSETATLQSESTSPSPPPETKESLRLLKGVKSTKSQPGDRFLNILRKLQYQSTPGKTLEKETGSKAKLKGLRLPVKVKQKTTTSSSSPVKTTPSQQQSTPSTSKQETATPPETTQPLRSTTPQSSSTPSVPPPSPPETTNQEPGYFQKLFSKEKAPGVFGGAAASVVPFFITKNPVIRAIAGTALYGATSYGITRMIASKSDKVEKGKEHEYALKTTLEGLPVAGAAMGLGFLVDHLISRASKKKSRRK